MQFEKLEDEVQQGPRIQQRDSSQINLLELLQQQQRQQQVQLEQQLQQRLQQQCWPSFEEQDEEAEQLLLQQDLLQLDEQQAQEVEQLRSSFEQQLKEQQHQQQQQQEGVLHVPEAVHLQLSKANSAGASDGCDSAAAPLAAASAAAAAGVAVRPSTLPAELEAAESETDATEVTADQQVIAPPPAAAAASAPATAKPHSQQDLLFKRVGSVWHLTQRLAGSVAAVAAELALQHWLYGSAAAGVLVLLLWQWAAGLGDVQRMLTRMELHIITQTVRASLIVAANPRRVLC
jgi:hypothetical protein